MRAVVVQELGPDYSGVVVGDIPVPVAAKGEVLVRVRAASVNFPDLLQTQGAYQDKPDLPFVLGMEIAGEVAAVGEDAGPWRVGDAVVGGALRGGLAEYALTDGATLRRKPETMSYSEAAALGVVYYTAYVGLVRRGYLAPGEWVLVHGAAGGVGLAMVDLAKAMGARVIAASASAEKLAAVQAEYATDAIVDITNGFRTQVLEITGGKGADVIVDPVGGDVFDESQRCIAFDGRLLVVGFTSGRLPVLRANIALIKGFSVVGVRAGEYARLFPDRAKEDLDVVWRLAEEGRIRPRIHAEYGLDEWRAAFEALDQRKVIGKAVILPDR